MTPPNADKDGEPRELSLVAGRNTKRSCHFRKQAGACKAKQTPHNPAIILLGIYPKELKTVHTRTCTQMFLAALFAIAKNMEATKVAFNK